MIGALAYGVYTAATEPAPAIPAPSIPKFNTESKEKDTTLAIPKEPPKTDYQYWSAALVNKQVVQIEGLTYTQARTLASMGGDIVCADRGAAIAIVKFYPSARWDMAHGSKEEGYLNHYHLSSAHTKSYLVLWRIKWTRLFILTMITNKSIDVLVKHILILSIMLS